MNPEKIAKIERFIKDESMSQAVYEVIHNSFLKNKGQRDIQILAAERLAVDFLDNAWKDLSRYKDIEGDKSPPLKQVGL